MTGFLVILALLIAPAATLFYFFWVRDRWEKEPWSLLIWLFVAGCFSVIPAAIIEMIALGMSELKIESAAQAFTTAFFDVALVEECVKFSIVYIFAFRNRSFNEPYDGIIYAVAVGLGFAFAENILYVVMALAQDTEGIATAIMRAFTAVPAHALDGVIMGFFIGLAKFKPTAASRFATNMMALWFAVFFHGLYDFFVFLMMLNVAAIQGWCLVGIVWTLIVQWGTAHRYIRHAQMCSLDRWRTEASTNPTSPALAAVETSPQKFCRHCGTKLELNASFCVTCGNRV